MPKKPAKPRVSVPKVPKRRRKAARRARVARATGIVRTYGAPQVRPPEVLGPLQRAAGLRRKAQAAAKWEATTRELWGARPRQDNARRLKQEAREVLEGARRARRRKLP